MLATWFSDKCKCNEHLKRLSGHRVPLSLTPDFTFSEPSVNTVSDSLFQLNDKDNILEMLFPNLGNISLIFKHKFLPNYHHH